MNTETEYDPTVVPVPEKRSPNMAQISGPDIGWTVICFVNFLSAYVMGESVGALVVTVLWVAFLKRLSNGRLYYVVFVDLPLTFWIRYVKKGNVPVRSVIPHNVIRKFSWEDEAIEPQGYLELSGNAGYGVAIMTPGSRVSARDAGDMVDHVDAISEITRTSTGKFALIYGNRNVDPWSHRRTLNNLLNPYVANAADLPNDESGQPCWNVLWTSAAKRDSSLRQILIDRDENLQACASEPTMMIMLTVPSIKDKSGTVEEMSERMFRRIFKQAELVTSQLRSAGVDAYIAPYWEMVKHFRTAFDAVELPQFYTEMQDYRFGDPECEISRPEYLPSSVVLKKRYVQADSNFIGAFVIESTPGAICPPDLDALYGLTDSYGKQLWYTVAIVGENGTGGLESALLQRGTLVLESLEDAFKGEQYREINWEAGERAAERRARIAEIGRSRYQQYYFNIVVLVYATSPDELDADMESIETHLRHLRLVPRRILGERPLGRAVTCALGVSDF